MHTEARTPIQRAIIDLVVAQGAPGIPLNTLLDTLLRQDTWDEMTIREALLAMHTTSAGMGVLLTSDRRLRVLRPNERAPTPYDAH
jgi:hypothetical protein